MITPMLKNFRAVIITPFDCLSVLNGHMPANFNWPSRNCQNNGAAGILQAAAQRLLLTWH
jgi:hypothetical protein